MSNPFNSKQQAESHTSLHSNSDSHQAVNQNVDSQNKVSEKKEDERDEEDEDEDENENEDEDEEEQQNKHDRSFLLYTGKSSNYNLFNSLIVVCFIVCRMIRKKTGQGHRRQRMYNMFRGVSFWY